MTSGFGGGRCSVPGNAARTHNEDEDERLKEKGRDGSAVSDIPSSPFRFSLQRIIVAESAFPLALLAKN